MTAIFEKAKVGDKFVTRCGDATELCWIKDNGGLDYFCDNGYWYTIDGTDYSVHEDNWIAEKLGSNWTIGTKVRKTKGSEWEGYIVGTYSTEMTPEGYCVESITHKGSVQIYPKSALEIC